MLFCFLNNVYDLDAINFATKKLSGVKTITNKVMINDFLNINTRVMIIVIAPENNWVKPSNKPSDN